MSLQLGYITVQFYTTSDDKDFDTQVLLNISPYVNGAQSQNLASYTGTLGGHLKNDSLSDFVTLGWKADAVWNSGAEYVLNVTIIPNGHDTWRFDCYLSFVFHDHTSRTFSFMNHALSQDVRSNDFRFVL